MNSLMPTTWYKTELDEIFRFVVKCGFITKPLLSDLFSIHTQRTLDRMAFAISRSKFFMPYLNNLGFQSWRLSRSGKYEARARGLTPSYPPRISSRTHDEMALSIAVRLDKLGILAGWAPESHFIVTPMNRLVVSSDNRGQKYPDLVLSLKTEDSFRVAMELELSRKSLSRYQKALTGYKSVRGIDAIIFAVSSRVIRESIEKAIRTTRFEQDRLPILFVDAHTFRQSPGGSHLEGEVWSGQISALATMKRGTCAA